MSTTVASTTVEADLPLARVILDDWWFAICGIAMIIGSDYKIRTRPPGSALGGGIDSTVLFELGMYGIVGMYAGVRLLRGWHPIKVTTQLYLTCCFVGLVVLSVSYSPYPQYSLVHAGQLVVLLLVVLAALLDASRAHMHRFAHAYLALVALSVLYGVVAPARAANRLQVGRFTWLAIHPTVSGVLTGIATVVAVAYVCRRNRPMPGPRWPYSVYVLLLVVVAGGLLATQTRGAVGGAIAAAVVVLVAMLPRRALMDFLIGLVVVIFGVVVGASSIIATYFARGGDSSDITTLNSRTDLWKVAIEAIGDKPVFGHGITASRGIFYEAVGLGGGHNAAINVMVELGILGFGVWLAAVIALFVGVRRLPRRRHLELRLDRALLLAILVFLMIDGIFFEGPGSVANVASTWFFAGIAWLAVLERDERLHMRARRGAALAGQASTERKVPSISSP